MTYVKTALKREITIDSVITIHYFEYMKDFVFHGESHDFWEFLYVDKGKVLVQAGEQALQLNSGDIAFHEPNEFHAMKSVGSSSPNLVAVSFATDSPAMDFFRRQRFTLTVEERTLISCLMNAAREALDNPMHLPSIEQVQLKDEAPFGSQQMILIYLEMFLVAVRRNHSHREQQPCHKRSPSLLSENYSGKDECLQKIIAYMQFHICEQLNVNQICMQFSMSRSSLQNLFHTEKNCGPMEYFNHLKIERAKDMIRDGTRNFTEISRFLSYSSLQYFSRQFRKSTGMSPMEYASSVKGISRALQNSIEDKEDRKFDKKVYTL